MPDYTPDELAFLRDRVVPSWNTDGKGIAGGIDLSVRSALFNAPKGEVKRRGQDDEEQDSDDRRFMSRSPDPRKKKVTASACCLYPYPFDNEGAPLYPPTDLPDQITDTFASVTLLHYSSGTYGDYAYSETGDDTGIDIVYPASGNWASTLYLARPCLIHVDGVLADEFPDTYTIHAGPTLIPVTRISPCIWSNDAGDTILVYGWTHGITGTLYKWFIVVLPNQEGESVYAKDDPQSAPDASSGSYSSGAFTVTSP